MRRNIVASVGKELHLGSWQKLLSEIQDHLSLQLRKQKLVSLKEQEEEQEITGAPLLCDFNSLVTFFCLLFHP
jgi:hypothetical protein